MVKKIRVLIVEDTLVNQKLLVGLISEDPRFEIAGIVSNGKQAVDFVEHDRPDIISMDLFMPMMDGVEATTLIMQRNPVPIVIVSSFYHPSEVQISFRILEAGALTILPRPFGPGHPRFEEVARNYRNTLKTLSEVKVSALRIRPPGKQRLDNIGSTANKPLPQVKEERANKRPDLPEKVEVIAIGASAGGPQAISSLLKELPKNLPVPVMIVQHIDKNFAAGYCEWLNTTSNIPVLIAEHGQKMVPGNAYLPPGDRHLGLLGKGLISVSASPPERALRPAVSFLFRNIHHVYGRNAICIILSGMGADGAQELKMLYEGGAYTMAQDEASSLVYGMPGEAVRLNGVSAVLSPEEIASAIIKIVNY